jgi:hypothetical protein
MKRTIAILSLLLIALVVLGIDLWRPKVWIEGTQSRAVVHLETLREYPTSIGHFRIEEIPSGRIVFEGFKASGTPQLWNMQLSPGSNSIDVVDPQYGTYRLTEPKGASFTLHSGQRYRITVWGNAWVPSHADLELK